MQNFAGEEADHRESGFIAARAASDVREKASLKFHVTTKWKQFDTRPARRRVYQIQKKRRSGSTEIRWNTLLLFIFLFFLPYVQRAPVSSRVGMGE